MAVKLLRRPSALAGILYLVTHVTSVAALILYGSLITDPDWIHQGNSAVAPKMGALADVILALAVLGTGVVLHSLLRHYDERKATAYVALRTLEAGAIVIGAAVLMAAISVRAGDDAAATVSHGLVGAYHWVFLLGMGLVVGVHTVILASLLYKHRLMPLWIPTLGIVGAVLVTVSNLGVIFGLQPQISPTAALAAVPIFVWEISLAVRLIGWGIPEPARP